MKQTLILLPGAGCDEELFQHQIRNLQDIVRPKLVSIDRQETRRAMADAVLDQAPEKFALAGVSLGGWVAQEVAARAPQRVSKLILISTWTRGAPEFWEQINTWTRRIAEGELEHILDHEVIPLVFHPDRMNDKELIDAYRKMKKRMSPEAYCRQLSAMLKDRETLLLLPGITSPTLVIHGRQDKSVSLEEQELMVDKIPNCRLAIVEDCGHATPMERPRAVTALMRYWLTYPF